MEQLITTKLFIPTTRPELVHRPHLLERLNEGLHRKLTLISAPAGFGKTTLVSEWVMAVRTDAENGCRIAWLSLDEGDNDPARFLTYLITALNQDEGVEASIGRGSLNMLQTPQPPPTGAVLTPLINELATIPDGIILVLDDYHVIESAQVDDVLAFLLEHLPPQIHLVIASRTDPLLPLSHIRASGQLTELRAADLRFSYSEAAEFLMQVMGLDLSPEDVARLETRTEGWIAGLQLAALSIQGKEDASKLIKSFSGSHRLVLDYLVDEVLDQQAESVQNFLLQTAILERFTGSLCDALTGQENGYQTLDRLDNANLFIVPLDEERRWYRYHHLFADLLRQRLRQVQPNQLPILYRNASEWYEQNGHIDDAIYYVLRAEDFERAVKLIEQYVDTVWAQGEYAKVRRWLAGLPDEQVLSRPKLSIFKAWELFTSGLPDAGERFLRIAELAYDPSTYRGNEAESHSQDQTSSASSGLMVLDRASAIQAWMAAYRRQKISGVIQHLQQALEDLTDQDVHWRAAVAITLADAHAFNGDMPAAYQTRLEALKVCEAAGNNHLYIYNSAKLALNLKAQGRLRQVQELCQQRIRFADESGMSQTAVAGWLLAIWAEVLAEFNDLDEALDLAEKSIELTESSGDVVILGWSYLFLTRILFSKGDLARAEEIVQRMYKVIRESIMPTYITNLNASWQARIWLAQNNLEAASHWMNERGPDLKMKPSHFDGMEYVGFVRILITQGKLKESISILERLLEAAQMGGNITGEIELLILQALSFQSGGDINQALATIEKALNLGEPRGFYRIFVDEGSSMASLLYNALERGIAPDYVSRLLQAFPVDTSEEVEPSMSQAAESVYVETLSKREIEVLKLIAEGLTNPEIAARLILSLYTVKTHTRNIYGKLGVNNRIQAVAMARTLGILSTT